ncbi:PIR protein [Plasmodium yoelii]|uniref:PIR protein n=2 Tax=Plasmodium yoelii TaxID=5861 RepID=A0AAE9WTH8_PLAYO|nr:PIR protein [Plasmodium yoelii]WBY58310.1 PIR protein [Plasmodium yoelii yoelii]VTZ79227.1 PIR protein [Plasmodium yoelii]|eukprot:XP_034493531.1 PIR protein [Plasmodium yoelii]
MEGSSYNIEDVYKEFVTISNYFEEEKGNDGTITLNYRDEINNYCHYENTSVKGNCNNEYFKMISSGVIHLINNLKGKNVLDYDKLAEYAILWLSYKLDQSKKNTSKNLSDFYTNYIEKNKYYNNNIINGDNMTYKAIINRKKDLMDNNEISKFNSPFNILYFLYYEISDEHPDCKQNLDLAKNFAKEFEKLNEDSNNTVDSSYNKLLSTLSNDYKNLIKKCPDFKSLSKIKPKKNPVEDPGKVSGTDSGQISGETSEGVSSSSITSKLIPVLLILGAIPIFLGIAYKYSLFGFDKLFQRQYIRKKLKKVKKKMKLNI